MCFLSLKQNVDRHAGTWGWSLAAGSQLFPPMSKHCSTHCPVSSCIVLAWIAGACCWCQRMLLESFALLVSSWARVEGLASTLASTSTSHPETNLPRCTHPSFPGRSWVRGKGDRHSHLQKDWLHVAMGSGHQGQQMQKEEKAVSWL